MNILPIGNYVAIKRIESEKVSAGGIIIPDTAQKKSEQATVVAVGPGKKLPNGRVQEPCIKIQDKVVIPFWGGNDLKIDSPSGDISCVFIKDTDILAVMIGNLIKPIHNNVLIKRVDSEKVSAGGIIIPDIAQQKSEQAIVVSIGPGKILENGKLQDMCVKPGEKVLISKWGGNEIKIDNESCIFIKDDEIIAVLDAD